MSWYLPVRDDESIYVNTAADDPERVFPIVFMAIPRDIEKEPEQ